MKYEDLLNSYLKYGNSKEDIIKRNGYENILENVVIAPWWGHEMFASFDVKIKKINEKIYNIYGADFEFSFIVSIILLPSFSNFDYLSNTHYKHIRQICQ